MNQATYYLVYHTERDLYLRLTPGDTCEGDWIEWVKLDDSPTFFSQINAEWAKDDRIHSELLRVVPVTVTLATV